VKWSASSSRAPFFQVTDDSEVLRARLAYAARGLYTFPANLTVNPNTGKPWKKSHASKALSASGLNWGMTIDPDEIRRQCARWPDAGIGIPMGPNGLWCLEADTIAGHGVDGVGNLAPIIAECPELVNTLRAISPTGSPHYYLRQPQDGPPIKTSVGEIAPGVDVVGAGGQMIAPPSRTHVGAYVWLSDIDNPILDPSPRLIEIVTAASARRSGGNGAGVEIEFPDGEPRAEVDVEKVKLALRVLPNLPLAEVGGNVDDPRYFSRRRWLAVLMATHHVFNGSEEGYATFKTWSAKNPDKHDKKGQRAAAWKHYREHGPVTDVTERTIFKFAHMALGPEWQDEYYADGERRMAEANANDDVQMAEIAAEYAAESATTSTETESNLDSVNSPASSGTDAAEGRDASISLAQTNAPPATDPTPPKPSDAKQAKPNGGTKPRVDPAVAARAIDPASNAASQVVLVKAIDVVPRAKDWIWLGHLLRGALGLMTGLPGIGKSQVHCDLVARASTGGSWPNNGAAVAAMNVIMVTAEDSLDQELIPRLIAAGADLERVHIIKAIKTDGRASGNGRQFLLGDDLFRLESKMKEVGDVGLVTLDPITAYMGGKIDSHKTTEVRSQLGPLKDFAERSNVAVSAITHPAKSAGPAAINHFIGSQAFIAAARIGHFCCGEIDGDERPTGRVLFTNPKNNTAVKQPTLAYRISGIVIDRRHGENISAPRITWEEGTVDISPDAAVAQAGGGRGDGRGGEQRECQRFLKDLLGDAEPRLATEVFAEGRQRGFTERQLRRAGDKIGVECRKGEGTFEGKWFWSLRF
jgi:hypothetical protein